MSDPSNAALAVAALALLALACIGWGRLARRAAGLAPSSPAIDAAIGLAALVFAGGVLNLARLAWPLALDALLLAGLALLAADHVARRRAPPTGEDLPSAGILASALWAAIAVVVVGFTVWTQLAPHQFNPGDDLQKYMAHALRMVRTGTLHGSPFNALGTETLGGQALLQGFLLGHLPIPYINGLDAVLGLGLCLALCGGAMRGRPTLRVATILATLAVPLIHPQSVNVSSLYTSAALVMALIVLAVDPREGAAAETGWLRRALAPGLLAAALIALKPTNAPFVALLAVLWGAATLAAARSWRIALAVPTASAAWAAAFLAPWLLLYAPYYLAGLREPLPPLTLQIQPRSSSVDLLSAKQGFYGASLLAYTAIAALLVVFAAVFLVAAPRDGVARRAAYALAAACVAAAACYVAANTIGLAYVEPVGALRYAVPTLIATFPAALALAPLCLDPAAATAGRARGTWLAAAGVAALAAIFAAPTAERVRVAVAHGTALAYLPRWSEGIQAGAQAYWDEVFDGVAAARLARFQAAVPAGEPLVAWIEAPILLDWSRNPVVDVNESGLAPDWAKFPDGSVVIWQYRGKYVRRPQAYLQGILEYGRRPAYIWARAFEFHRRLTQLAGRSEVLAHDDAEGFIVFRLPASR